uniref:allophycocyanin gamma subunit n=1 Tax=Pseudoerythrocladia kornmannii TaxID=753682 RepID=UPI001FCD2301|nr:allophycocyanin gamma subunit [Pseudoerythrocladia kornmannii]UNJ16673.1 allophycocyanin gamma subunit [Pseudoerythrocladia kornmannii]
MSLVSEIILNSDDELRYPTIGELESIRDYLSTGENRIRVITLLRNQEKDIIRAASKRIFQIHPEYIAPGGNASGARQRSLCLRDYGWYLRLITYGILAGDKRPIEAVGIIGVREMYNSLGVPMIGMIDAIQCLKEATLNVCDNDDARFVEPYFDFLISGMS